MGMPKLTYEISASMDNGNVSNTFNAEFSISFSSKIIHLKIDEKQR